jgi:hypothetical protein
MQSQELALVLVMRWDGEKGLVGVAVRCVFWCVFPPKEGMDGGCDEMKQMHCECGCTYRHVRGCCNTTNRQEGGGGFGGKPPAAVFSQCV